MSLKTKSSKTSVDRSWLIEYQEVQSRTLVSKVMKLYLGTPKEFSCYQKVHVVQ